MGKDLAILSLAIALGLALGNVRIAGARLGISAVLFTALLLGQLGLHADGAMLGAFRDFSLIIFVYAIGLQVGPGFLASLRSDGLRLNLLAIAIVLLGAGLAYAAPFALGLQHLAGPGLFSGSFTTTAGLGAAQDALRHARPDSPERDAAIGTVGLAYTVTYPFALVGPTLCILLIKWIFRVDVPAEAAQLAAAANLRHPPVEFLDMEVTAPEYVGIPLRSHPLLKGHHITLTRLLRADALSVPHGDTELQVGDVLRASGPRAELDAFLKALGRPARFDMESVRGDMEKLDLVVTRPQMLRRTLAELNFIRRAGVTVAWVNRAGVTLSPERALRLQFGDRVRVVGPRSALASVEAELGNSQDALTRTQLLPVFLGIVVGVLVGMIPIWIPGLHSDLRIGLAGGALIAAVALSQLGNIGSVVWYMPVAANQLFQDFGLAVFLACVGLRLGDHLLQNVVAHHGLSLLLCGVVITLLPPLLIGVLARALMRMNFITLAGLISGATTSSPALNFSRDLAGSDAPAVAFATVAPLAELIPILCAQLIATLVI